MPIKYYDTMPEDTTGIECALVKPEFRKTEQSLEIGGIIERKLLPTELSVRPYFYS